MLIMLLLRLLLDPSVAAADKYDRAAAAATAAAAECRRVAAAAERDPVQYARATAAAVKYDRAAAAATVEHRRAGIAASDACGDKVDLLEFDLINAVRALEKDLQSCDDDCLEPCKEWVKGANSCMESDSLWNVKPFHNDPEIAVLDSARGLARQTKLADDKKDRLVQLLVNVDQSYRVLHVVFDTNRYC